MRIVLLLSVGWLGALNAWRSSIDPTDSLARLLGLATVLSTLTVLVYRLGVWRQDMENTKDKVCAEVKAHREEAATHFDRVERRLDAIDHLLGAAAEQGERASRRLTRAERRLERLEASTSEEP
jgi:septal ring factor EnvC (AmiA/AmiB activator)